MAKRKNHKVKEFLIHAFLADEHDLAASTEEDLQHLVDRFFTNSKVLG